jgi:hypothetical protein
MGRSGRRVCGKIKKEGDRKRTDGGRESYGECDSWRTVLGSFKLRPVMVTRVRRVRLGDADPAIRQQGCRS